MISVLIYAVNAAVVHYPPGERCERYAVPTGAREYGRTTMDLGLIDKRMRVTGVVGRRVHGGVVRAIG
ncbi:MAG: hypothetical protein NVSMB10_17470 [Steroidobacteraceae bacterium]